MYVGLCSHLIDNQRSIYLHLNFKQIIFHLKQPYRRMCFGQQQTDTGSICLLTELIIDSLVHIVGSRLVTCRWGASITPHQTIHQLSTTLLLINVTIWVSAFHAIQSLLNQNTLAVLTYCFAKYALPCTGSCFNTKVVTVYIYFFYVHETTYAQRSCSTNCKEYWKK